MLRPIVKIHGGKRYLFKWIIDKFPKGYAEMRYVEPCGGAASVLLNKVRSVSEIYNDLDPGLFNLVYCLKNHPAEVIEQCRAIPYTEEMFKAAKSNKAVVGIGPAVDEMVKRRMSRGGLGTHFGWSNRKRGGKPGDVNAWETFTGHFLPLICERLKDVEVSNQNVCELLPAVDGPDLFTYIDPPYLPSTRTAKSAYNVEMTEAEHMRLAGVVMGLKGKVLVSGYYSPLYLKLYKGWKMHVREVANHSSQSKKKERRLECMWANFG